MKITRLRLSGFKSFVEPTELHIEPGLTGIVGPNGCGKSNLLEALRWAMGENSAKSMRGGAMDDVIFAGAGNRPARNMAEVTIFMDNTDHSAPAAFNGEETLEITRRIEREAGSAYRINGSEVRQRDVQLLFADASTGAHSPALVKQGQIGALISAKPLARRAILEEAAGISGLHSRRHEAELRLRAAETNLQRLTDIIQEVEGQLAALKRQARQASRYRNLSGHIRRAEAVAFHLRWVASAEQVAEAERRLAEAEARVAEATRTAAQSTTLQAEAQSDLPPLRQAEAERAAALQRFKVERDTLDAEERRAREASARLARAIEEFSRDLAASTARADDARAMQEKLGTEASSIDDGAASRDEALHDARVLSADAADQLSRAEAGFEAARARAADHAARRHALENAKAQGLPRLTRLISELEILAASRLKADEDAAASPDIDAAARDAAAAREAAEGAFAALNATENLRQEKAREEALSRDALTRAERAHERLAAEADAIADVLRSPNGDLWPRLIDAVSAAPGYEAALAAALGEEFEAPLDEAAPSHWRTLPTLSDLAPLPEGAEPISAHVTAPPALARRLALTGVVEDADGARLQALLLPGQILVSRSGALWRWDGYTVMLHAQTQAAQRLAQRNRLAVMGETLAALASDASAARGVWQTAQHALDAAQESERAARAAQREADAALARALDASAIAEREAARHSAQRAALAEAARRLEEAVLAARNDVAEADAGLIALGSDEPVLAEAAALRERVSELRIAATEADGTLAGLVREAQALSQRRTALQSEIAAWSRRLETAEAEGEGFVTRRDAALAEKTVYDSVPETIEIKRSALLSLISEAEVLRNAASDALQTAETRLADADRAVKAADAAASEAREERARAGAMLDAARERLAETASRIREVMSVEPGELLSKNDIDADDGLPTQEEIDQKVERLKREREQLGGVNLRAEEEAAEHEERLNAMVAEKADLEGAIAKLRAGIGSLNREGRERLLAAFDVVNAHFKRLFTTLFGGGEANLTLTESDDPLEAGLEIFARPPGKRLTTLSLLSGGEQALTALSLIFAIFLSNPAPICVLDEVDAPLDDANVERFCNLMDEMTRQTETRFLVITHHALTMARVHRLFGVTMQERGVSQLVSVDLEAAERVLAAE